MVSKVGDRKQEFSEDSVTSTFLALKFLLGFPA